MFAFSIVYVFKNIHYSSKLQVSSIFDASLTICDLMFSKGSEMHGHQAFCYYFLSASDWQNFFHDVFEILLKFNLSFSKNKLICKLKQFTTFSSNPHAWKIFILKSLPKTLVVYQIESLYYQLCQKINYHIHFSTFLHSQIKKQVVE